MFCEKTIKKSNGDEIKYGMKVLYKHKIMTVLGFDEMFGVTYIILQGGQGIEFADKREVSLIKNRETFDDIAKALKYEASQFDIDECRAFGKRFLNCKEANNG